MAAAIKTVRLHFFPLKFNRHADNRVVADRTGPTSPRLIDDNDVLLSLRHLLRGAAHGAFGGRRHIGVRARGASPPRQGHRLPTVV